MSAMFDLLEFEELRNPAGRVGSESAGIGWPPESSDLVASNWLRESPGKRRAFELCYEDILSPGFVMNVADIGGGVSHITKTLLQTRNYVLVDPLHHVSAAEADSLNEYGERTSLQKIDWFGFSFEKSELVIANDIFPNVDFRLGAFLEKLLASDVRELRLVLTVFYGQRFMEVCKIDSGEVLTVIPLPFEEICKVLNVFCPTNDFLGILQQPRSDSDWSNGRFMYFMQFQRS